MTNWLCKPFSIFFDDVCVDGGKYDLETVQQLTFISNHFRQGLIWNEESSIVSILKAVIPDVSPDEAHNLAPWSSGPPNDSLEVGTDWELFWNLAPSRMHPFV